MNYCESMKNIYVHLGYPKTGSTFIQRKIFPQLKSFKIYDIPFNKKFNHLTEKISKNEYERKRVPIHKLFKKKKY